MIFYTDRFIPDGAAACARGPAIFIRPAYCDDAGLLEHERVHVRQWWRTLGAHSLCYLLSQAYRLRAEVEAYREQARHYSNDRMPVFAKFIAERYGLSISEADALKLLRSS